MTDDGTKEIKEQAVAAGGAGARRFADLAGRDDAPRLKFPASIGEDIQTRAMMISAHFLLPSGARVVDMGCGTGEFTYAFAMMNPRVGVIGFDPDEKAIAAAQKTYKLPNLAFSRSDLSHLEIENNSLDGIINAGLLHRIYSNNSYNPEAVAEVLDKQFQKLKTGGMMVIRDYLMPPEKEFVLLELPNTKSRGQKPAELSGADLLILFSQTARPMNGGSEGFFIEEKPPLREEGRLFRLPHKWALEFIHRKQHRREWESELKKEYTFFTDEDYNRVFAKLGVRMVFSSPYQNPWVIKNRFKGRFQIYAEDGTPLGMPPTNHFIVAQKVSDKTGLVIEERKPSQKPVSDLKIVTVRDKKSGAVHELVKRPGETCDIIPFRITPDGRLVVYVRSGAARPIVNAISRGSFNIDGKKWSGHLVEPISMHTDEMAADVEVNRDMIFKHVEGYAGLTPKSKDNWYVGDPYFPAPDMIDEAIEPVFVEVENPQKTNWPAGEDKTTAFSDPGSITELDGADILRASQVGLMPDPRLELHVYDLMRRYHIAPPRWIGETMPRMPGEPIKPKDPQDILKEAGETKFEDANRGATLLKPVKSVFVEKGQTGKAAAGSSAQQDVEFVVSDDGVENIAVIFPMTRDLNNNILVAVEPKVMPVPNRLGGDGAMLNAPSFPLPKDIRSMDDAKEYVAKKFKVPAEQVGQLGESYFVHTGVTPQRIFMFTVASPPKSPDFEGWHYALINDLIDWDWNDLGMARFSKKLIKGIARFQMRMNDGHTMVSSLKKEAGNHSVKAKTYHLSTEKVAIDRGQGSYSAVPSRILGQRGRMGGGLENKAPEQNKAPEVKVKKLCSSYSQAGKGMDVKVTVKETPVVTKIDKDIENIGLRLKKPT